jgi:hypothetical protein
MKTLRRGLVLFLSMLLVTLFCSFLIAQAQAANWYVRPSGGSGSGTSWTTAWNGINGINWGSVSAGDTVWVAGGTYTSGLSPAKSGTSGARVYVRRARSDASECTGAAGWSSAYDSTVHQTGGITFGSYNYIMISGRTTASGGSNGWWLDFTNRTSGSGIEWPNGSNGSYITIEYMDLQGPGAINYTGDGRGIDDTPFSSASNHTFSHMKIWDWESGAYVAGINNPIFEYIDMYNIMAANWSTYHPNGIYIQGSNNGIVRYSKFHYVTNGCGEGVFFASGGSWSNWQIYGNLFYDLLGSGLKSIEYQGASTQGVKIYNNTFVNNQVNLYLSSASCDASSESRNNLIYGSGGGINCGTSSNNLTASSDPFVNRTGKDFHIVSSVVTGYPRNAGVMLGSVYNTDMDGVARGADGSWDIGAYEYNSGSPLPPPPAPAPSSSIPNPPVILQIY